jgi:two-component system sensor histidine kinase AlgZ
MDSHRRNADYALVGSEGLSWREATALSIPLSLVYAFVCLAAWYPCQATPVEKSGFARLVLTHLTAAALLSILWAALAKELGIALARYAGFVGVDRRLETLKYFSLLWAAGVLLYILSVTFHYVLMAEQAAREAQERALEARILARDAELKALRAQVDPHFMFNCLHSISALTSADAGKAREMCILLADFLRSTLRLGGKETITLGEELDLVRGYLAVEKMRFGARVELEEEVDNGTMGFLLPPLLLQPLVENAIRHGIANLPEGGVIRLTAQRRDDTVSISVENSFDPDTPASLKTGLGLDNIPNRLTARYGRDATILVGTDGARFSVRLRLPMPQSVSLA